MRTFTFGVITSLGFLVACQTEREEAVDAVEDLRETEREAAQDVREAVQEGREDVAEARREMVNELRELERSGEPVVFDAVVTGHDEDTMNLRLETGEMFDVDYGPTARLMRGTDVVTVNDLQPGTLVHVTYRYVDGRRMVDQVEVREPGTMPGTHPATPGANPDMVPGAGGGTR